VKNVYCIGLGNKCCDPRVGQIIDIAEYRDITLAELALMPIPRNPPAIRDQFVLIRVMPFTSRDRGRDEVDYPMVCNALIKVHHTPHLQWHCAKAIKAIAFVFHINQVNNCLYSCAGRKNAFIVQVTVADKDLDPIVPVPIDKDEWCPFVTPFGDCKSYSKRMWNSLASTKELCWRSMTSSKSQWDGRTKHVHFPGVNKECMQYSHNLHDEASAIWQPDVIPMILCVKTTR
jgi:hypothetical protein